MDCLLCVFQNCLWKQTKTSSGQYLTNFVADNKLTHLRIAVFWFELGSPTEE